MAPLPNREFLRLDASADTPSPQWAVASHAPSFLLRCDSTARITTLHNAGGKLIRTWSNPLEALAWMRQSIREPSQDHEARWIGYFSYDFGRLFEQIPSNAVDDLKLPLFAFALQSSNGIERHMEASTEMPSRRGPLSSSFTRDSYLAAVKRALDYIGSGDVFQVNLSQRFIAPSGLTPLAIYRKLLKASPARYGAFLDFGDHALICNSPELFFRVSPDRKIVTCPIKGTRPRLAGMETVLRDSIKDQAELNMIVDLERNDLGRVCEIGSVRVTDPRTIETHPTVYHGVATIEGTLRSDVTFVDLLRAIFPGGSVTGTPKVRAMQIIDELEPIRRGPYCGAIGYLASDGSMEFNIAIRTMIAREGLVYIPVGGGIVADSDPVAEYEETLVKGQAMFDALDIPESAIRNI